MTRRSGPGLGAALLAAVLGVPPAAAQEVGQPWPGGLDGIPAPPEPEGMLGPPLSAIDWLSDSVQPVRLEPPVSSNASAPVVITTPLDRASKDAVGLLPPDRTGLPRTLWQASREADLLTLLARDRSDVPPALQNLTRVMMLTEATPPADSGADDTFFLARVDRLLAMGAIEEAKALIEEAGPDTPALFRRWFDTALLTGDENRACDVMLDRPDVAPTYIAQVFCIARGGDWMAAALTLNSHRALENIDAAEEALAARFLDPEIFEGEPPLDPPARVTPLAFRMHEAIGERLPAQGLPLAFAHADLRDVVAWKSQIEAAERLSRRGAISENRLLELYTARDPAASGGVWDRAAAVQAMDAAIGSGNTREVARLLPETWALMQAARLELPFARLYGQRLGLMGLTGPAGDLALRIGLLSPAYLEVAQAAEGRLPFLTALARGVPQEVQADGALRLAVQDAFNGAPPPQEIAQLLDEGRTGEAILRAIDALGEGSALDARHAGEAIAVLRAAGLEDVARRTALQLLLLERPS